MINVRAALLLVKVCVGAACMRYGAQSQRTGPLLTILTGRSWRHESKSSALRASIGLVYQHQSSNSKTQVESLKNEKQPSCVRGVRASTGVLRTECARCVPSGRRLPVRSPARASSPPRLTTLVSL
eukprot:6172688-Pleurochrysis_carterae.AAC.1